MNAEHVIIAQCVCSALVAAGLTPQSDTGHTPRAIAAITVSTARVEGPRSEFGQVRPQTGFAKLAVTPRRWGFAPTARTACSPPQSRSPLNHTGIPGNLTKRVLVTSHSASTPCEPGHDFRIFAHSGVELAAGPEECAAAGRGSATRSRVLVVDADDALVDLMSRALRIEGWRVATAGDGRTAIRIARTCPPDAVVLDAALLDMSALTVIRVLSDIHPGVALLLLSDAPSRIARNARLGAGDCATKPFSTDELVLRLRGLMRRSGLTDGGTATLAVGDLILDEDSHRVSRGGDEIILTKKEFLLLRHMMRHTGRAVSKEQILDAVWDYQFCERSQTVAHCVSDLRRKIDYARTPMIRTIRGTGYMLKPPG